MIKENTTIILKEDIKNTPFKKGHLGLVVLPQKNDNLLIDFSGPIGWTDDDVLEIHKSKVQVVKLITKNRSSLEEIKSLLNQGKIIINSSSKPPLTFFFKIFDCSKIKIFNESDKGKKYFFHIEAINLIEPKRIFYENLFFHTIDEIIDYLDKKGYLKREDWIIEESKK